MTSTDQPRRVRLHHLQQAKEDRRPLTMLTAYDALTAPILEAAGVDMLLVGDSLGNVTLGFDSTLKVTVDDMERAVGAVARSTSRPLIVADLPFGTYETGPQAAFETAARLMRAGAHAVKARRWHGTRARHRNAGCGRNPGHGPHRVYAPV